MMERKLETVLQREYAAAGGVRSLAAILNAAEPRDRAQHPRAPRRPRTPSSPTRCARCCSSSRTSSSSTTARSSWCCARSTRRISALAMRGATRGRAGEDPDQHVPARRRDAARGDGVHAAAAPPRRRGGADEDRRRRAQARGRRRDRDLRAAATTRTSSLAETFEFGAARGARRTWSTDDRHGRGAAARDRSRGAPARAATEGLAERAARRRARRVAPALEAVAERRAADARARGRDVPRAAPSGRPSSSRSRSPRRSSAPPVDAQPELVLDVVGRRAPAHDRAATSSCSR